MMEAFEVRCVDESFEELRRSSEHCVFRCPPILRHFVEETRLWHCLRAPTFTFYMLG
jgi:hypothetical protein